MAHTMGWSAIAAWLALTLLASGCGHGPVSTPKVAPVDLSKAVATGRLSPGDAVDAATGPPIQSDDTTPRLPMVRDDGFAYPVAGLGEWIVVSNFTFDRQTGRSFGERLTLWNPASGQSKDVPHWRGAPDWDRNVLGATADRVVILESPLEANHEDLVLLDVNTGKTRVIASPQQGRPDRSPRGGRWGGRLGRTSVQRTGTVTSADQAV